MSKRKAKDPKKARINLRIEVDLSDWIKQFAEEQGTTMTAIVLRNFVELRRRYDGASPEVEQI